jgi:RNA polymerase subunit RPABC4/transcription elongation factor Spt4
LNDEEVDNAMPEAHGIKVEKRITETRKARTCLNCKTHNPPKSKYCLQCGSPLDFEESRILHDQTIKVADTLTNSDLIRPAEKELLSTLHDNPELESELPLTLLKGLEASVKFGRPKDMMDTTET